ncbi:hypothetical protein NDU88_001486 [Pleurodeles waltl]|uniref:Uncharacterized protein n=1 Tax=Pleurodeles waltl TaxID=8319 RepID=A0AAV7MJV1_PLEWA|nr:hypothetical protein NDU88_001486 [Pleurodeles waltl]
MSAPIQFTGARHVEEMQEKNESEFEEGLVPEECVSQTAASATMSKAGSIMSGHILLQLEAEDRQAVWDMKVRLVTLALEERKLATKETKAAAELSVEESKLTLALEVMKVLLAHETSQRQLALGAKKASESSEDGESDSEVPRKGKSVHILKYFGPYYDPGGR